MEAVFLVSAGRAYVRSQDGGEDGVWDVWRCMKTLLDKDVNVQRFMVCGVLGMRDWEPGLITVL